MVLSLVPEMQFMYSGTRRPTNALKAIVPTWLVHFLPFPINMSDGEISSARYCGSLDGIMVLLKLVVRIVGLTDHTKRCRITHLKEGTISSVWLHSSQTACCSCPRCLFQFHPSDKTSSICARNCCRGKTALSSRTGWTGTPLIGRIILHFSVHDFSEPVLLGLPCTFVLACCLIRRRSLRNLV